MKITLEFPGKLKRFDKNFNNKKCIEIILPSDSNILTALRKIQIPQKYIGIIVVNDRRSNFNTELENGDHIRLYPHIAGG